MEEAAPAPTPLKKKEEKYKDNRKVMKSRDKETKGYGAKILKI